MILMLLLVIVAGYTAYQAYRYWFTPRTVEVRHFMQVEVVTDKNLTLDETLGYSNDSTLKYIILQEGSIYFYSLSLGQNLTRELEVTNIWNVPVEVTFNPTIELAPWFSAEGPTILGPKESQVYNLTIKIPEKGVSAGRYQSHLNIRLTPK
jgi:hypothetical protein